MSQLLLTDEFKRIWVTCKMRLVQVSEILRSPIGDKVYMFNHLGQNIAINYPDHSWYFSQKDDTELLKILKQPANRQIAHKAISLIRSRAFVNPESDIISVRFADSLLVNEIKYLVSCLHFGLGYEGMLLPMLTAEHEVTSN
jgi:hypothetical protein